MVCHDFQYIQVRILFHRYDGPEESMEAMESRNVFYGIFERIDCFEDGSQQGRYETRELIDGEWL